MNEKIDLILRTIINMDEEDLKEVIGWICERRMSMDNTDLFKEFLGRYGKNSVKC